MPSSLPATRLLPHLPFPFFCSLWTSILYVHSTSSTLPLSTLRSFLNANLYRATHSVLHISKFEFLFTRIAGRIDMGGNNSHINDAAFGSCLVESWRGGVLVLLSPSFSAASFWSKFARSESRIENVNMAVLDVQSAQQLLQQQFHVFRPPFAHFLSFFLLFLPLWPPFICISKWGFSARNWKTTHIKIWNILCEFIALRRNLHLEKNRPLSCASSGSFCGNQAVRFLRMNRPFPTRDVGSHKIILDFAIAIESSQAPLTL